MAKLKQNQALENIKDRLKQIKTEEIKERIKELFQQKNAFGIAINGKWGVGKTVFWNEFVRNNLSAKKVAYISLFGVENISNIERKIIFQISTKDKYISSAKDKIKDLKTTFGFNDIDIDFGMISSVFNIGMSLFEKKDFENVIVCFDDFERISDKLKLKDVLGLISELKEQKNCQVVMILNKDELKDEDLSKYKDKIVDFDFNYEPSPEESFLLIKDSLKAFKDYPLEYFQKHNINNIRVMKRVINALNDFQFIEEYLKEHKDIKQEVVENILEVSTINANNLSINFEELSKYSESSYFAKTYEKKKDKGADSNKSYDELLTYINFGNRNYFYMSDITYNVVSYIENSIIDKESLQKSIDERIEMEKYSLFKKQIQEYVDKGRYDLNYTFDDYTKDLYKMLEENKSNITKAISSDNFIFYINQLKEFDRINIAKYDEFAIEIFKQYLNNHLENIDARYFGFEKQRIENIIKFDKSLDEYYNNYKLEIKNKKIDSSENIIQLMLSPTKNRGYGEEPVLLSQVSEKDLEKYFFESQDFVESSLNFLQWIRRFSSDKDFEIFRNKLISAMKKIYKNGNKDQKIKIQKILEYLKEEIK
ncbi:MAG: hypothetical protein ACWGHH_05090 [Sulfurovaceae bacterium]